MQELIKVILISTASFTVIAILAKLMGKKQLSQIGYVDYIVGISIGSIAAEMAFATDIPFYYFIVAMIVYFMLDLLLNIITPKSMFLKNALKGKPIILIEDGKLLFDNLKQSKLDLNDLLSLCRLKNCFDINDIGFCIFETSGELSILLKSHALTVTREDMKLEMPKTALSTELVLDGKIIESALKEINKSKQWLLDKLKLSSEKDVKKIAIATYNSQSDSVTAFKK